MCEVDPRGKNPNETISSEVTGEGGSGVFPDASSIPVGPDHGSDYTGRSNGSDGIFWIGGFGGGGCPPAFEG